MHARPRMLMNSQPNDGTPGGAPSVGQVAPAPAPAQGTSTPEQQASDLKSVLGPMFAEFKNGIFADLRKAGALGKAAKTEATTEATTTTPAQAEDVQTIIARERAFNRASASARLTDGQFSRMERAFAADKPDDPAAWVRDYVADLGVPQQAGPGALTPTQATSRTGPPVSDTGSPAPIAAPSDQAEPWRISDDEYQQRLRRDGYAVTGANLRDQFHKALRGRRVRLK